MSKVLLIDDDRDFRKLIVSALSPNAIQVVEAPTCADADRHAGQGVFDLILVDGLLPDGRGVQWIERLRQHDRETRVVFLSAFWRDLRTFEHLTRNLDVSLVLYKPIDAQELVPRLVELMKISQPPVAEDPAAVAFAQELERLRKEFESNLPKRLAELEEEASAARADPARKKTARSLAHRLRGSSGTFGFGGVGEAVGVIEDLLNDVEQAPAPLPESLWGEVRQSLANARRLLDGTAAPPPATAPEVPAPVRPPILVLDGDPDALQFLRKAARQQSTEVLTAQTPAAALQLAAHQPLLGALIDAGDATEASIAFGKQLRATRGNENVPIAFASDDARLEVRMAAIAGGAAIAIGSRPLRESRLLVHQPWYRELAGRCFNKVVRLLATPGIYDTQCGFKLLTQDAARTVFSRCVLNGFSFDVEALFLAHRLGCVVAEIPVRWAHQEGSAAFSSRAAFLRSGLRMLRDVGRIRWLHRAVRPLDSAPAARRA